MIRNPLPILILAATFTLPIAAQSPGSSGIWTAGESKVLFSENFESTKPANLPEGYGLEKDASGKKDQFISGQVTEPGKHLTYPIPFSGLAGQAVELTFRARSPHGTRCAVWIRQNGEKRRSIGAVEKLPKAWKEFTMTTTISSDSPGFIDIVAPSSHNSPPGSAMLDDIAFKTSLVSKISIDHPEDFPVMCRDAKSGAWIAVTARPDNKPQLRISRILGAERKLHCTFQPDGITGIGMPDIADWSQGCVVCLPIEREGKWQIACLFIARDHKQPVSTHFFDDGMTANIDPAIDVRGDSALIVWEGNRGSERGIHALQLGIAGEFSALSTLDSCKFPSANPDVVFLDDGSAFAVWDSYDGTTVHIHGSTFRNDQWGRPRQLTSDPRIERHPALATDGKDVWLAWQAQSFEKNLINKFSEQRIVVANVTDAGLKMVPGQFETISPRGKLYLRPQLEFTPGGNLVISARESLGAHTGWRALAWTWDGGSLSKPVTLWQGQGRWRPVSMAIHDDRMIAACQRDNLPRTWGIDTGKAPDWKSDVVIVNVPAADRETDPTNNLVPLTMPETDFSLTNHTEAFSNSFPRKTKQHAGKSLTLYWGDMHEHSDLSVCQRAQNPPVDDLWANQRDIEQLDFTAITDHGYNLDHPQWHYSAERVRAHYDERKFVSLLAEEWTSDHVPYDPPRSVKRYGHHNLIFKDPYYPHWHDSRDVPPDNPRQVWDKIGDNEFISIPHQIADTGNNPTDWTWHDEHHQPLVEIFQQRESYEYLGAPRQSKNATPFKGHFIQDAWELGVIIGIIASPDHGGGKGKAGIWAEELTRDSLFDAFHARHSFGTSGAKMSLWVSSGDHMMGDKAIRPKGDIPFHIRASADRPITKVVLMRNNREVFTAEPGSQEVDLAWQDKDAPTDQTLWYYARIHRDDEELAWSSPIWFFTNQMSLEATAQHARELPHQHPHGPPADDPGPQVNWRKKVKRGH